MNPVLEKNNYIFLPNLIDPQRATRISKEYESFSEYNQLGGDDQAPNSRSMYDYKTALELLCELTPRISELCGATVLPTYSYIRVYQSGDDLKKHSDRDSCEISVTLNLGGDCDWPIYIERSDGTTACVTMKPGDAMLYLGCRAMHWRDSIPGTKCVQVFLHYVDSNGPKACNYFDKSNIGRKQLHQPSPPRVSNQPEFIDYSKMPRDVKGFIKVFENAIPNDLCDLIIKEYSDDQNWQNAQISKGIINDSIRKVNVIKLDDPANLFKNIPTRQKISFEMNEVIFYAMQKYKQIAPGMTAGSNSGYDLLRYNEGDFYTEHTDSFIDSPRHVSCSFHLNDDYEGGEFAFFNREFKIKAKKGALVIFPSNFMFPHEILPVTKGTRFSIITWLI